jgi:hypothetical protein
MRVAISSGIEGATAPARLPSMNSTSPAMITGRRPKRSDSGATTRLPKAMASSDRLTSSWAVEARTANCAAMAGSAGSSTCMLKGPRPPIAAEATISRRPSARRSRGGWAGIKPIILQGAPGRGKPAGALSC